MSLLLDTHVWIWSVSTPERLPAGVRRLLEDETNEVLLSLAIMWEVAIKYTLGRLTLPAPPDPFRRCAHPLSDACRPREFARIPGIEAGEPPEGDSPEEDPRGGGIRPRGGTCDDG